VGRSRSDGFRSGLLLGPPSMSSITCWGRDLYVMTADFKRAHSCFLIATRPLESGKTLCEGVVSRAAPTILSCACLWQPLNLMVRRWLTYEFVADESRNLLGIQYNRQL